MKKHIVPILVGSCLLLSGCWHNKEEKPTERTEEIILISEPTDQETREETADKDQFKILHLEELLEGKSNTQALHDLISEGNVILDFYATWCPPCKAMHPIIDKLAAEYHPQVKIIKIDIDKFNDIANRFEVDNRVLSVKGIPQFYFFKNGKLTDEHNGGASYDAFKQKIEKLINLE